MNSPLNVTVVPELAPALREKLERLIAACYSVGESWGGSPLGYHSSTYRRDFSRPSSDEFFSQEWGLEEGYFSNATVGDWVTYSHQEVSKVIRERAAITEQDVDETEKIGTELIDSLISNRARLEQQIYSLLTRHTGDAFLEKTVKTVGGINPVSIEKLEHRWTLKIPQIASRDMRACSGGITVPPHKLVEFAAQHILANADLCRYLNSTLELIYQHVFELERTMNAPSIKVHKVFIGHGRSELWRRVSDFVQTRLKLPYIEFTSAATAGLTITERLTEMLDEASIAVIVMSGEDETVDGKVQARMNVIHEAGLFQGRLGVRKVVILLEEGCEEFSNIHGLGQIRFPKGNISACFENLRHVFEREGVL